MTKIAIVGRGTAGCLSYLNILKNYHEEFDWYYDSSVKTSSVGEGTTPNFTEALSFIDNFEGTDCYEKLDARPKVGIEYLNWGKDDFVHPFKNGQHGVHFNATKFQEETFKFASKQSNVTLIDKNVDSSDIDADLVVDCTGYPKSFEGYRRPKYIPVNAVHVTQCSWKDSPKWEHTKTIARKWGWVFVIPLLTRCSVGYLYNRDISTLDQVKEDVAELIEELDVTPTETTNSFHFENYVKEELVTSNIIYAGNSGFFLEPMEATTLDSVIRVSECATSLLYGVNKDQYPAAMNHRLHAFFNEVEYFIMMHYAAGSKWNNEFWDYATERGRKALEEARNSSMFADLLNKERRYISKDLPHQYFESISWHKNLEGLGLAA